VWTADGRELVDWTMALGAVSLGYAHPAVVDAVARAAAGGGAGPLPPVLEVEVAERLVRGYPGAEQARFFKTGAEAVQAAVRIARVATGRQRVVACGYHGWLDGPTAGAGVPAAVSGLWSQVPFGDAAALEAALREPAAALVLEPVIEREPPRAWLAAARDLTARAGAVLVFDEIKTAFRLARGGAAQRWGVTPDLAVLGKALANGAPLAAVVGRADLMARCRETWISSTLATESTALAAALAVMDVWDAQDVAAHLRRSGAAAIAALPPGPWDIAGIPEMFLLRFHDSSLERDVLLNTAERGVLLKRGAYNFPSLAHGDAEIGATVAALEGALAAL
jgi:glutamate-1-semialdehyde aminotransferase